MKDWHYNTGLSTALKSTIPGLTAVCIFCGKEGIEAYKEQKVMESWERVAAKAIEAGQTPPEPPVKIVNHVVTRTDNNFGGFFGNTK